MCNGFGIICDKDLNMHFVEPGDDLDCSHSDILRRLGRMDNDDSILRNFIRLEYRHWEVEDFSVDESSTLPGWAQDENSLSYRVSVEIMDKANKLLEKVQPAYKKFSKTFSHAKKLEEKADERNLHLYYNNKISYNQRYDRMIQSSARRQKLAGKAMATFVEEISSITGYVKA